MRAWLAIGAVGVLAAGAITARAFWRSTAPTPPATPPTAPPPRAWCFPGDDVTFGIWAGPPTLPDTARIAVIARDVMTGARVEAVCALSPPGQHTRTTARGGIGPWAWDVALGEELQLDVSSSGHRSASGIVELPTQAGGVRAITAWLVPFGAPLQGRVVDGDGAPVAAAAVSLELPAAGEGSIALATERCLTGALAIPSWREYLLQGLTWSGESDVDGYFSLAAIPGTTVTVLARTGTHHGRQQVVVPADATRVAAITLKPGPATEPSAPQIPALRPTPPDGRVSFAVRGPGGTVIDATVTLQAGSVLLHTATVRDGWTDWAGPARTGLTLTIAPAPEAGGAPRVLTFRLQPRDRLWLGTIELGAAEPR